MLIASVKAEEIINSKSSVGFYTDTEISDSKETGDKELDVSQDDNHQSMDSNGRDTGYTESLSTHDYEKKDMYPDKEVMESKKYLPQTGSYPLTVSYYMGVISLSFVLIVLYLLSKSLKENE